MTDHSAQSQINLLLGFDAMRIFLDTIWKRDGRTSDDLAVLLGNLSRDAWVNSQPVDIAQWSDWLDAILAVQPDLLSVKDAQLQRKSKHQRLMGILKMPDHEQRSELEKFRAQTADQPWHLGGDCCVSTIISFAAMRSFLSSYWDRGHRKSDDISEILNALGKAADRPPSAPWNAWLEAVQAAKEQRNKAN